MFNSIRKMRLLLDLNRCSERAALFERALIFGPPSRPGWGWGPRQRMDRDALRSTGDVTAVAAAPSSTRLAGRPSLTPGWRMRSVTWRGDRLGTDGTRGT
jgi:hypothetical protein